ncbi:AraC family transcriptional regulator [Flavobacterium ajazii]|uniref:AraC family transcriptional regulator n=1 Tax=Flavobacterium ajazii TaxID=2692318 RepID=UPI0013D7845C|nr:helix-turn-helix transcriptional regulator [Flavobacterium ajazii]
MKPIINKYIFKPELSQEVELVDIAELYKASEKIITTPHRVGFYVIVFVEEGTGCHFIDFNKIELQPNTILFFHKDIVQQFDENSNIKGKAILFTDTFFSETEQDTKFLKSTFLFNNLSEISLVQDDDKIKFFTTTFNLMLAELKNLKDVSQKMILKNLLQNFLLVSEREIKNNKISTSNNIDLDHIIIFKNQLENYFTKKRSVNFYTQEIGLTEKRLNLATKKILGKTAKEVIDDRIMLEAKRLLANTSDSVKEIGFLLGFEEPTYFIQYFKKHTSTTPIEFREKYSLA